MPNPVYPTLKMDQRRSKRIVRDGREEDDAGDGTVRVRKLHPDLYDFEVTHPGLDSSDLATLTAFYAANANAEVIDFTWPIDSVVYPVRFGKGALQIDWANPTKRDVRLRLVAAG